MKEENSTLGLSCVRRISGIQQCVFEVYTASVGYSLLGVVDPTETAPLLCRVS